MTSAGAAVLSESVPLALMLFRSRIKSCTYILGIRNQTRTRRSGTLFYPYLSYPDASYLSLACVRWLLFPFHPAERDIEGDRDKERVYTRQYTADLCKTRERVVRISLLLLLTARAFHRFSITRSHASGAAGDTQRSFGRVPRGARKKSKSIPFFGF